MRTRAQAAVSAAVGKVGEKLAAQKAKLAEAAAKAAAKAEEKLAAEKAKIAEAAAKAQEKLAAERAKIAAAAAKAEEKLAAEKTKLASLAAKARLIRPAEAATASTPNQVILARGFWQGVPDDGAPMQSAAGAITAVARPSRSVAAPVQEPTGSVAMVQAQAAPDRVAPELALSYAEQQPGQGASALPAPSATDPDAMRASLLRTAALQSSDTTTVIAKRVNGHNASVVINVATRKTSPVLADMTRLADPWLRAIMVTPSVNNFLCITSLGARDFRTLSAMMVKPANSVIMTFTADPNAGLSYTRFSGTSTAFIPTVSYTLRTAQLH